MRRSRAVKLMILIALLAAVLPVLAAIYLAREQGLDAELARVTSYARVVVNRSDRAVDQMNEAIDLLAQVRTRTDTDCSPAMLDQMREISVTMEYVKVIGVVEGDLLVCSSMGLHPEGIPVGSVDVVAPTGTRLRYDAPAILAQSDTPYVSLERDGLIAMAQRNQAVDVVVDQEGSLFATFDPTTNQIRTSNAPVNPEWVTATADTSETAFVADGYIVAVIRSDDVRFTGAIAAIPVSYLNDSVQDLILLLLPIALLAGAGLSASLLYLARQQASLPSQIRLGLKREEFFLEYQPVVDLDNATWLGVEALLRWRRRDGEVLYPDAFVPAAEQSGLVNQLSLRVIELVERDLGVLISAEPGFFVTINLSARDLQSERVLDRLLELKRVTGATAGQLVVELTERMLVEPENAARAIENMRSRGIHVAIDDFGTGYCSLSYLEQMRFDALKIDKLFVEAIDKEAATSPVVLHIIDMARTLGMKIVAEGVETPEQEQFLKTQGVQFAQGWLYSKSLPVDKLVSHFYTS